jgi:hypothetical protein
MPACNAMRSIAGRSSCETVFIRTRQARPSRINLSKCLQSGGTSLSRPHLAARRQSAECDGHR